MKSSTIVVFGEDWGTHNSSCQRIVRELSPRHRVTWVNTIGTRRPKFDWYTARRGLTKFRHWSVGTGDAPGPDAPRVIAPVMWPSMHTAAERKLNRFLLGRQLAPRFERASGAPVVVAKVPLFVDLIGVLPARRWVYYCVDDVAAWPGSDRPTLERLHRAFVARADAIIVASEALRDHVRGFGREAALLTHGVDAGHWREPRSAFRLPEYPRPLVVYWGLVDRRIDVPTVEAIDRRLAGGTILFVGPRQDPPARLRELRRVRFHPPISYDDLPRVGEAADVLIMPYARSEATFSMQPLKLKEYMATGKPVVARCLPSTAAWSDAIWLGSHPECVADRVDTALRIGITPEQERARLRLERESWAAKARQFERLIFVDEGEQATDTAR